MLNPTQELPHLTPEEECIMQLSAVIAAIHFETNDEVTKQFATMMAGTIQAEYLEVSKNPNAIALFLPRKLTETFRNALAQMRTSYDMTRLPPVLVNPIVKNGHKKT